MIKRSLGFTLIEMMVVLAIVAILAAIAYPSYQNAIRKARRADAVDALYYVQNLQEKFRANNTTYSTLALIGYPNAVVNVGISTDAFYTITGSAATATTYTVTATGLGSQAADTSNPVNCTTLTLTITAANPKGLRGSTNVADGTQCWAN